MESGPLVVLFLIVYISCVSLANVGSKVVLTLQGPVRGYKNPNSGVYEFYGIPYALAPTKGNKFQAPLPPKTWSNTSVFEAIDRGIVCLQGVTPDINLVNNTMQEDCLIVNIFVPDTVEKHLPVLVYIHGGGFQVGYGNIQKFTAFVKTQDIIVVNFNYRLGIIGNLCLGTEAAPGNAGLKDQIALLRWVNKNIAYFGGDTNKVTLCGCSTGAASTDILGLSNSAKGLFNKMIVNSGSSLDLFAVQINPTENALNQAKKLKLTSAYNNNIKSLEAIYRSMPLKLLTYDVFDDRRNSVVVFSPCVEKNKAADNVLTDAPHNILKNRMYSEMPILYTYTQMEGLMKKSKFNPWIKMMKGKFSDFLPGDLKFDNDEEKEKLAKVVQDFYFNDVPEHNDSLSYVEYFTDVMFVHGILKSVEMHVEVGNDNVYLQEYSYVNENSPTIPNTTLRGATHCSQVQAVADEDDKDLTEEYKTVKHIMREMWGNFIRTGEPSPEYSSLPTWPAVSKKIGPIMCLDKKLDLKALPDSFYRSFTFWDNIYEKYYQIPVPPI